MQTNIEHLEHLEHLGSPGHGQQQWENCLVGSLETWPLADVILWLHQGGRSAMVRVGVGINAGVLFFVNGHLFRAEWGHLKGEQALIALLGLTHGAFTLIQRQPPDARPNIIRPTAELLLQLAVAQDERSRVHQA
ncbi:MAG: DUF4388 domain-containing protein [Myxococcota bacterium]